MAFNGHLAQNTTARSMLQDEKRLRDEPEAAQSRLDVFVCEVAGISFKNDETGFFVMKGLLPKGEMPPRMNGGRPFLGRHYTVVGESKSFLERDRIGQLVECYGGWIEDPRFGPQFKAQFVNEKLPSSPEAIEAFLASGKIHGLGESFAKKVVDKFGAQTLKILDETPERLLEITGFGQRRLDQAMASWKSYRGVYEIMSFMQMHGIGDSAALRIYAEFGDNAIRAIEQNPYALTRVPMVGFKTADRVAKSLGVSQVAPFRIQTALRFVLEEAAKNEGHTTLPVEDLNSRAADLLELPDTRAVEAQTEAVLRQGALVERLLPVKTLVREGWEEKLVEAPRRCVSSKGMLTVETRVAQEVARLLAAESSLKATRGEAMAAAAKSGESLDETQRRALRNSFAAKVSVITGGPGTGKTHTIKSVIAAAEALGAQVVLCAPTGRAAKRMEEATGRKSSTIHRLLGFGEGGFKRNEQNKLEGDVFIVDEASMIDIWLVNAFLKAIPDGANLIFVGDVDQLPSVGAGNVLADFIDSGSLPVSRLGRIHRQAAGSKIIVNAHKIIHGQMPELCAPEEGEDFAFIEAKGNEQIQAAIVQLVQSLLAGGAKPGSIQALAPQKNTEVGTIELNATLRPLLNERASVAELMTPEGERQPRFCRGDRVMQLKNNYELELFNGDVGLVESIDDDGAIWAEFDGKMVEISHSAAKDIQLAYACTIHKSQGSEHPIIIVPMSRSHSFMMSANLLYTAVTRGKAQVWLVGEKQVVFNAVRRQAKQIRHTGLRVELRALLAPATPPAPETDWFGQAPGGEAVNESGF
jgi:exodeoxyribonuclease V alpha subunit